ncbi:MAG: diacylglycerol/lipid kinase family protein [Bacteroidota bacterium]
MKKSIKHKILFIVNPLSGREEQNEIEELIVSQSDRYNYEWRIYKTKGEEDRKWIEKEIDDFNPEMLVSTGGDGTVNLVASILINRNISMGIIPGGSANGLAYNLNIPNNPPKALEKCLNTEARPIDMIRINDKHTCIHLSDIGINARIVKRFEEEGARGLIGYGKQFLKEFLTKSSTFRFDLKFNQSHYRVRAEMLVVANAQAFGTGALINPDGKIDDGKFELLIIKPYPWWFVFPLFVSFFTGNFSRMKYVDMYPLEKAQIELDKPAEMQIDGEIMEPMKSIDIKIIPKAVKVHY